MLPAQLGFEPLVIDIETEGTTVVFITIVMPLDVAVVGDAHAAFEVRTQVTTCPLVRVDDVKLALLVPAFTPFTFH